MTRSEFLVWQQHTESSKGSWVLDPIHNGFEGQDLIMHKGGESGSFIRINRQGLVEVGTYEGAIPHIGEAEFRVVGSHRKATMQEAANAICDALGLPFHFNL